ncbi:hypothetical protein [Paractinoplanes hotanensis]|uniref:Uncharacterized protein n=1 Tax=Paractinoplanes hotanensis TaxID=2906497 RepID=A0ABT0XRU1_9ACTN|nr:hypothetical protein [Actinoplanes hotanensis]MCM4076495.1 hypothetical protein [Actinoplanes hotanensis]
MVEGALTGVAAVLAMAGSAVAALLLLDGGQVGRLERLTAAIVAMAAGAPAQLAATPSGGLPIAVHGRVDLMPLGVSVIGAVVLGTLVLRRGCSGLLVRGASASAVFTAGVGVVAAAARGTLTLPTGSASAASGAPACPGGSGLPGGLMGGLGGGGLPGGLGGGGLPGGLGGGGLPGGLGGGGLPGGLGGGGLPGGLGEGRLFGLFGGSGGGGLLGGLAGGGVPGGTALDAGFVVGVGPAVWGAAVGAVVVVALCWLAARVPAVAGGLRGLRWPVVGLTVLCLVAAWVIGGPAAAGVGVLGLPFVVLGGLPWAVHTDGMLSCVLSAGAGLPGGGPPAALIDGDLGVATALSAVVMLGFGVAATAGARHVELTDMLMQSTCQSTRRAIGGSTAVAPRARRGAWRRASVRAAWVALAGGVLLTALALLSRVSAGLTAQAFILTVPLLDVRLAVDPWVAAGAGVVAAATGSLLASAFVSWRHDASR